MQEFRVYLMEGASKGRIFFLTLWDNDFFLKQQLAWFIIYWKIQEWENGKPRSLLRLAKRIVKNGKGSKMLYSRALKVSRFLDIRSQTPRYELKVADKDGIHQMMGQIEGLYAPEEKSSSLCLQLNPVEQNSWSLCSHKDLLDKNNFGRRLNGETFEKPFLWTVHKKTYIARSVNDIRKRYDVLVEGPIKCRWKVKRRWKWRHVYGFLIADGVLIFLWLRHKVRKRAVDCRKNTINLSSDDNLYLNVQFGGRTDQLKFLTRKQYSDWHVAIKKFSE